MSNDALQFIIPNQALKDTVRVLRDYGRRRRPHEGFVYWGGIRTNNKCQVRIVIAPHLDSRFAGVRISAKSNILVVKTLVGNSMVELAQVHSHPGDWVDHSQGDDMMAPFKVHGLISIVVPNFGKYGMLPLEICGLHRFEDNGFRRLSHDYVRKHFLMVSERSVFRDLR